MSALEVVLAAAGESALLPQLDYNMVPSSSSVVDRMNCKVAYPVSASTISLTGGQGKTCRIRLGGDNHVDSSSLRLQFTIVNKSSTLSLQPYTGPWGCWANVRLLSQGKVIEDIPLYGRHHELFGYQLLPFNDMWSEASVCGLGGSWAAATDTATTGSQPKIGKIEPSERAIVMHKLHLSLFNSAKIIPVRFMPCELEVTLADAADWLAPAPSFSQLFDVTDVKLIYDEVVLDQSIVDSMYKSLISNNVISIPCQTAYQFSAGVPAGATEVDVPCLRAFSKLCALYVTFSGNTNRNVDFLQPGTPTNGLGLFPAIDSGSPGWAPSIRVSVGGKNYPDPAPLADIPSQYYQLVKTLGYSPNISRDDFVSDTYVLAFDLKRVPFDLGSGISTRSGDTIRIAIKNLQANKVTQVHVTMFAYTVLALRESGCEVLN
jgi:hypothetical protein